MDNEEKPVVHGPVDGNIFAVTGAAGRALKRAGLRAKADELYELVPKTQSYDEALRVICEYVDFDLEGDER